MLERVVEQGIADFNKVKSCIEQFEAQYKEVVDRYEITATAGVAVQGYYIALNSRLGHVSWDRLELPECYNDIPVAVRRKR
jgi:hypothetical protein